MYWQDKDIHVFLNYIICVAMRYLFLSVCFLWVCFSAFADKVDEELFRLKVADAERCGWDTLSAFRHRCKVEQGKALRSLMLDDKRADSLHSALCREGMKRYSAQGWVRLEEIFIPLPQYASRREVEQACRRMDSVYVSLQRGVSFETYVKDKEDSIRWRPKVALLDEFSRPLETMRIGTYSEPFLSPLGVHIIKLVDEKSVIDFQEAFPSFKDYVDRLGKRNPMLDKKLYAHWRDGVESDSVIARCVAEVKNRLLAEWWDIRHPLSERMDEKELERYFHAHKQAYAWEFPHYKGAVVFCQDKKTASRIRKRLKKVPVPQMADAFREWQEENPGVDAMIQVGLFQIGSNPYIDKLAFKCGELPHDAHYPYVFIIGKRLKKGPENYTDVRRLVEKDFRLALKQKLLDELKARLEIQAAL